MSLGDRWLLPEGIDELLPPQAMRLESLRRCLLDLFQSWGYELVIPPLIEYLESLLTGMGHDLELQTFKITDQLTGRLMGIRADMTPQAARIDARLKHNAPTRLCYLGPVLHTLPNGFDRSRNPFQVGAELYGHRGIESDAEVILLMLESLRLTGIAAVWLDLGHMGVFRGLARQAGLNPEQQGIVFDILQRKAQPELETYLKDARIAPWVMDMFIALMDLNGDAAILERARCVLAPACPEVQQALDELANIAHLVQARISEKIHFHFDLAELRGYHYHTGVMFAAYIPGYGQALARGGRYDDIGRVFGRARPATGFSTDLKTLVSLQPFAFEPAGRVYAPWPSDPQLAAVIERLRKAGNHVICALPGQPGGSLELRCNKRLERQGEQWVVVDRVEPEFLE
jgi:ATP phosphoribosyltransferase regulatory subunit